MRISQTVNVVRVAAVQTRGLSSPEIVSGNACIAWAMVNGRSRGFFELDICGLHWPFRPGVRFDEVDPMDVPRLHYHREAVVIADIHPEADGDLAKVVFANGEIGQTFSAREGRQQKAGEDRDDGDDDEEFDQSEGRLRFGPKGHALL